jgi:hypothetical protein
MTEIFIVTTRKNPKVIRCFSHDVAEARRS